MTFDFGKVAPEEDGGQQGHCDPSHTERCDQEKFKGSGNDPAAKGQPQDQKPLAPPHNKKRGVVIVAETP